MDFTPRESQVAIKLIKDFFERKLSANLNLTRVSAPLFIRPETGINDNLTGVEKAVSFKMRKYNKNLEIVQSLAKWKRLALRWYEFGMHEGIYTDMDAIRPDEILDSIHSIYVDQWDWEKVIREEDRNENYLRYIVNQIYNVFKETEKYINAIYSDKLENKLPEEIKFITSQELLDLYPNEDSKARENLIIKKHKAVFLAKIGGELSDGKAHDVRSPDYDDWNLNGDILFYNPILDEVIELSSMGIRVDEKTLLEQLETAKMEDRKTMDYHKALLKGELPYTVGGGIGQSRICMFFLQAKHIGQVQASVWTDDIIRQCEDDNLFLL